MSADEVWDGLRHEGKERRARNRLASPEVLRRWGVTFESKSNGVHLVVTHRDRVADFWPGTGKWRIRPSNDYRRGVFPLLRALGVAAKEDRR